MINSIMGMIGFDGDIGFSFPARDVYKTIAYQMQSSSFEDEAKVLEVCNLYKKLQRSSVDAHELLERFDLLERKDCLVKNLSGGQRQILAILLTLLGNPKVLIYDELTTGLDSLNKRVIWDILKNLNEEKGITIILASHFLEEVEYLADRVVILNRGEVEKIGYVDEIVNDQFRDMKKIQFEVVDADEARLAFGSKIKVNGRTISFVYSSEDEDEVFSKVRGIQGENIVMRRFSFEDAFLQMLGYRLAQEGEIVHE